MNGNGELQHLLSIEGLPREILLKILDTAESFVGVTERDIKKVPLLRGKSVFNLFFEGSTRTRTTFEIAAKRLSADVINLNVAVSSTSKGESLLDTVANLSAMQADIFVVRHGSSGAAHLVARHVKPHEHVINAGDGRHAHPTQGLLDLYTIRHYKKDFGGLTVAIVGDVLHSRVARSLIHGLTTLGAPEVRVIGPQTLIPAGAAALGVRVFHSMREGLAGADVVVMLRLQNERMSGALLPSAQEFNKHYGLTAGQARAGEARRHRHAPRADEPRRGDRLLGRRRPAFGDPAAGDLRHLRAHGGDEHDRGRRMKLLIRNGRVVDPKSGRDAVGDVFVADGQDRGGQRERPTAPSTPRAWSSRRASSTSPRACASRATNTRRRSNPRWMPRWRAA